MYQRLNRVASLPVTATRIKVVMVTDDRAHARALIDGLAQSRYVYLVTELGARETLAQDLEREIEAVRGQSPMIVMLDFEFLRESCEAMIADILAIKQDMAIECLVTRPPSDAEVCDRLRATGVFLFDTSETQVLPFAAVH